MEAVECGAAALAMVLAHHGRWCRCRNCARPAASPATAAALPIWSGRAALWHDAQGFRCEPKHLATAAMPCIVFVDMNHYVVLEGIRGRKVYLNDPAAGRRVLSPEEFDATFSGIVLTFARRRHSSGAARGRCLARPLVSAGGRARQLRLGPARRPCSHRAGPRGAGADAGVRRYYLVEAQADWVWPLIASCWARRRCNGA